MNKKYIYLVAILAYLLSTSLASQNDSPILPGLAGTDIKSDHLDDQPVVKSLSLTESSGKVFVGSINSNKYHYPDCTWAKKIHPENEIWFSSSEDARSHGYVPCKVCNPP